VNTLSGFTEAASQVANIDIGDGTTAVLTLSYRPLQSGWFYDLAWNGNGQSFAVNGRRLVTSPNILRQFQNKLPFGLMVATNDDSEPTQQDDLSTSRATIYLLDATDISNVNASFFPGL
jgi:hypothetical protein